MNPKEILPHSGWIRTLTRRLLVDPNQADDVAQRALLAALENPPQRGAHPRAWLTVIARNLVRQDARSRKRRSERERKSARREDLPSSHQLVERAELQKKVVQAVMDLPEPYRTTVLLRYLEELPSAEIARRLEIPSSTVRNRLKRGLALIRDRFDRENGGDRQAWCLQFLPLALSGEAQPINPASELLGSEATRGGTLMISPGAVAALSTITLGIAAFVFAPDSVRDDEPPPRKTSPQGTEFELVPAPAPLSWEAQSNGDGSESAIHRFSVDEGPAPPLAPGNSPGSSFDVLVTALQGLPIEKATVFVGGRQNPFPGEPERSLKLDEDKSDRESDSDDTRPSSSPSVVKESIPVVVGRVFETGPRGRAEITSLHPSNQSVVVKLLWSPGIRPVEDQKTWNETERESGLVELSAQRVPTGTLRISALDESTGNLLPDFLFRVRDEGPEKTTLLARRSGGETAEVVFELTESESLSVTVELRDPTLDSRSQTLLVRSGQEQSVQLRCQSADGVQGTVVDSERRPLEDALVFWGHPTRLYGRDAFRAPNPDLIHDGVRSELDGRFELRGTGRFLTVFHPEHAPITVQSDTAEEIVLSPIGSIRGVWKGADSLTLDRDREILLSGEGRFEIEGALPGTRSLFGSRHVSVQVAPGETVEVQIGPFLPEVSFEARASGQPYLERIAGVLLARGTVGSSHELVCRDGAGRVEDILPGPYLFLHRSGRQSVVEIRDSQAVLDLGNSALTLEGNPGTRVFLVPHDADDLTDRLSERNAQIVIPDSGELTLRPFPEGRYRLGAVGGELRTPIEITRPETRISLESLGF